MPVLPSLRTPTPFILRILPPPQPTQNETRSRAEAGEDGVAQDSASAGAEEGVSAVVFLLVGSCAAGAVAVAGV